MADPKPAKKTGAAGSTTSAFMKPLQPDAALAAVVGSDPLPRTEVTKKIWEYVKANNLQDPQDKRTIRADAKLKPIFGGKDSVSMFEMTKLVNSHLSKG
jgi:upstream activation factor subunit UAF30